MPNQSPSADSDYRRHADNFNQVINRLIGLTGPPSGANSQSVEGWIREGHERCPMVDATGKTHISGIS